MQTQKIFQAGNSQVVAIPKHLSSEMGLKVGQKISVIRVNDDLVIKKSGDTNSKIRKTASGSNKELKQWLKDVLREDGELLDQLAVR